LPVLTSKDLHKAFGSIQAVKGVSCEAEQGEIFGLVGPDGAGKSTTLRMLAGLLKPDQGFSIINDADVLAQPDLARCQLGYMPQHFALYSDLSVKENLAFFADMYLVEKAKRRERLERLYRFSRLEPYSNRPAGKLSGGMQKKLALMCAMIHTPKVLILDEPTTGVDPLSRRELWDILYAFADQGVAIVVSTPYMDEAERCHKVALMHSGAFVAFGNPKSLVSRMEGRVLAGRAQKPVTIAAELMKHSGVSRAYQVGHSVHVVLIDVAMEKEVISYGAEWLELKPQRPSFEDLFLDLTGEN